MELLPYSIQITAKMAKMQTKEFIYSLNKLRLWNYFLIHQPELYLYSQPMDFFAKPLWKNTEVPDPKTFVSNQPLERY